MSDLYTFKEAQEATGEPATLITFLITERDIPVKRAGMAKVLDASGMKALREAIAEYRAKAGTIQRRHRRREPAATS